MHSKKQGKFFKLLKTIRIPESSEQFHMQAITWTTGLMGMHLIMMPSTYAQDMQIQMTEGKMEIQQ